MQKTSKKILGFSLVAICAIAVALMFAFNAHALTSKVTTDVKAAPQTAQKAEQATVESSNATVDFTVTSDQFGFEGEESPDVLFSTDTTTEKTYTDSATVKVNDDETFTVDATTNPGTISFSTTQTKIYFKVADDDVFDYENTVFYYEPTTGTHTAVTTGDVKSINKLGAYAVDDADPSIYGTKFPFYINGPSEFGVIGSYFGCYQENFKGELVTLKQTESNIYGLASEYATHASRDLTYDAANQTISWVDYRVVNDVKTAFTRTVKYTPIVTTATVTDFEVKDAKLKDAEKIVYTTDPDNYTQVYTSLGFEAYNVNDIDYYICTLDGLKYYLSTQMSGSTGLAKYLSTILNMLPSTVAFVQDSNDEFMPETLSIPETITVGDFGQTKVDVVGILPNALTSKNIKHLELSRKLLLVCENAASGLDNLESVSFETGCIYIPSLDATTKLGLRKLRLYLQLLQNPSLDLVRELYSIMGEDRAFPYTMVGSNTQIVDDEETAWPYFANDNPLLAYKYVGDEGYDYDYIFQVFGRPQKGTFEKVDEFQAAGFKGEKFMLGTGSITGQFVDSETGEPVVGAEITFTDELGIKHETTTNQMGVATVDGYQTAGIYAYQEYVGSSFVELDYRNLKIECAGFETVDTNEKDYYDKTGEPWPYGCYIHLNQMGVNSADTIISEPIPLTRNYYQVYLASASNLNYFVDVAGASTVPGGNIQCYENNMSDAQKFNIINVAEEEGKYELVIWNENSELVLDVANGQAFNGANVQQYGWNKTAAQIWIPEVDDNGLVTLHSKLNTDYVLDLNSGVATNGQNFQVYQTNGTNAQKFKLLDPNPSTVASTFDQTEGEYVISSAVNDNICLDVQWASDDDGGNVWAYNYTKDDENQIWKVKKSDWGYYTIVNARSGKALDVSGNNLVPGTNVQQYYQNGTAAQQWAIYSNVIPGSSEVTYTIVNVGTGLALDLAGGCGESQTNVQGYFQNGTNAQNWTFTRVR